MRHKVATKRLGRPTDQRLAIIKSLVAGVLQHGYVVTTETRAKEARRIIEHIIDLGKTDTLTNRRLVRRWIPMGRAVTTREKYEHVRGEAPAYKGHLKGTDRRPSGEWLIHDLFTEIGPRFQERAGGYLRLTRLGGESHKNAKDKLVVRPARRGDAASLVKIELVD